MTSGETIRFVSDRDENGNRREIVLFTDALPREGVYLAPEDYRRLVYNAVGSGALNDADARLLRGMRGE